MPFGQWLCYQNDRRIMNLRTRIINCRNISYSGTPPRIKGRGKNRTGDNFLVFFTEKHWQNRGKFRKKLDGRQKIVVGGRARPKYRPSFYTEGLNHQQFLNNFAQFWYTNKIF